MSVHNHKKQTKPIKCIVVTISDTRTIETDKGGNLIIELLKNAGHVVEKRKIIPDQPEKISQVIEESAQISEVDAIITTGGTGIAARDVTIEVVQKMLDKEIPGFGELFRMLSYTEDIGSAALLSRSIAGVYKETAIFSVPGSSGAVKLAMNKLILPELVHIVNEVKKDFSKR